MRAAANLLGRAVALLPEDDPARLHLLPDLAEALIETGDFATADAHVDAAIAAAKQLEDDRLVAHSIVGRLLGRLYAGGDSESWGELVLRETPFVIDTFQKSDDHAGLAKIYRLVCLVHVTRCQFGEFLQSAELGVQHAKLADEFRYRARAVTAYTTAAVYGPTPVPDALRRCQEVLVLAEGDKRSVGVVTCLFANLQAMHGNFEEARDLYALGRGLLEEVGADVVAASTALQAGAVELLAGDTAAAERELRRGYEKLSAIGETYFAPSIATMLAHVLVRMGRDDEAIALTRRAEEVAAPDDVGTQALWRLARAKAIARQTPSDEAVSLAREGLAILRQTDAPIWQADALVDLHEVLVLRGALEEARACLDEALTLYESKGDLTSLDRTRLLAERLPRAATASR